MPISDRTMISGAHWTRGVGEERHAEAQQAVAAELEQHAGEDHRAGGRCLDVRVGQPGVEREHRHLDREGEEEAGEGEELERRVEAEAAQRLVVERAGPRARGDLVGVGHAQDRDEHEQRADERVEDELDRGVDAVGAAPDADDQVHRDEHELPEDVEEEHVEREEHADHADLEHQEGDHVLLHALLDRPEAGQDADPRSGSSSARRARARCRRRRACTGCRRRAPSRPISTNWKPGWLGSKLTSRSERHDPGDERRAQRRPADPGAGRSRGRKAISSAPTSGQEDDQRQQRQACVISGDHEHVRDGDDEQPGGDAQRVVLDAAGLDVADAAAGALGQRSRCR